ncbi:MAG: HAD family hydrolase [Nitrospiraceae bacterium]
MISPTGGKLAFLFDLDGTLVDSVYQHVLAWREALQEAGVELAVWRIHRQIGMSGGLLINALLRETGHPITQEEAERLQRLHAEAYARHVNSVRLLPGARELLDCLSKMGVPYAIATSGRLESARHTLQLLTLHPDVPIITRDQVHHAKPDPDLFLAAAERLNMPINRCTVVGDSVWDLLAARRAWALGVGLLSGGYGQQELEQAGAYRVYQDPADLLNCPQLWARGYWVEVDHPTTGPLPYPGEPVKMSATPWQLRRPAPLLGQHTAEVLAELGIEAEECARLRAKGVV